MCSEQNKLVAYCRILPPGEIYEGFSSIGRVFTVKAYRYQKYGRQLMSRSIEEIKSRFPHVPIKIQAQQYLLQFYQSLGFEEVSESYLHDDILHVDMVLEL
jgi:ElaA protein